MTQSFQRLTAAALLALCGVAAVAADADSALSSADANPNDWLMYHQSYRSWHFSALDQINTQNVQNMRVAWSHTPAPTRRGIQSSPIVVDGVLYYTGGYSQIYALDAATGQLLWSYKPKQNPNRTRDMVYTPFNRGLAVGFGNVYVGTSDGRAVAVDRKTGKLVWDVQVVPLDSSMKGFTGAPLVVKDKVVLGTNGGSLSGCCGPIFAVDAKTGKMAWQFDTIAGDERSRASWGNDSWKVGGGGGWQTGTYDPKSDTIYWGTGNPSPSYDWGANNWKTDGARPGENLYTSSVIALDPDTGKLKSYFQEMPHDMLDFDSAVGEFVQLDRGGKRYIVHPNKSGFVFVYENDPTRPQLKIENVWKLSKSANFVRTIDPATGELVDRRALSEGMHKDVCPSMSGAISFNSGSYSPDTGLYYKSALEICMDLEVLRTARPADYTGTPYFGATSTAKPPPGRSAAYGHVSGRDPLTGKVAWEVEYKYPPLGNLLATQGGLLFVPGADGWLDALDARTGKKLWTHNNGIGHRGGVISYAVKGKQYVAVIGGWGSFVTGNYPRLFGEPFTSMPVDTGLLTVFSLQ